MLLFGCLTAKVSGPQNAGPLDRRVRPEGQKGAPSLEDGRSPRKTAGPRKRRSAAKIIAGGACCTSGGGQKGMKSLRTGRSAETSGCAHKAGDGTNSQGKRRRSRPLDRRVRPEGQKGAPRLEDGRSPRKTAGPRKQRSAARRIAGGACCTSAGGPKGLKAFGTGRSAEISGCAHRAGDGTNGQSKRLAVGQSA